MDINTKRGLGRLDPEPDETAAEIIARLLRLMQLEQIEVDLFRGGRADDHWSRVFGGQVVGQALMAASQTIAPGRLAHSMHAYFMRPGDPAIPIVYQVSRDRDGGSFSSRRVVAIQHGKAILNLAASFHDKEEGFAHQVEMPAVPPPEALENEREVALRSLHRILPERHVMVLRQRPIEFRAVDPDGRLSGRPLPPHQAFWFRSIAPLPDGQVLHRALLAYASDMMLLPTALLPHGKHFLVDPIQEASLDHALWIHSDVRVDEWLLYSQESPWSGGARGLSRGQIFTRDGRLVASVAQEGLIRPR